MPKKKAAKKKAKEVNQKISVEMSPKGGKYKVTLEFDHEVIVIHTASGGSHHLDLRKLKPTTLVKSLEHGWKQKASDGYAGNTAKVKKNGKPNKDYLPFEKRVEKVAAIVAKIQNNEWNTVTATRRGARVDPTLAEVRRLVLDEVGAKNLKKKAMPSVAVCREILKDHGMKPKDITALVSKAERIVAIREE